MEPFSRSLQLPRAGEDEREGQRLLRIIVEAEANELIVEYFELV